MPETKRIEVNTEIEKDGNNLNISLAVMVDIDAIIAIIENTTEFQTRLEGFEQDILDIGNEIV